MSGIFIREDVAYHYACQLRFLLEFAKDYDPVALATLHALLKDLKSCDRDAISAGSTSLEGQTELEV